MRIFDEFKKLTRPYSGSEYDDFGDEVIDPPAEQSRPPFAEHDSRPPPPERRNPFSAPPADYFSQSRPSVTPVKRDKVISLNNNASSPMQMVLVKPERFETAPEIADHLRNKRPVLINLEHTQKDIARRLLDFLSGIAYALDGKIKRIATNTYLITPYNVDIVGEFMDELESRSLYQ